MTPPEGTNAKLMRAHKRVLAAIEDLEPDEQDRVLDAAQTLLGYSRPVFSTTLDGTTSTEIVNT